MELIKYLKEKFPDSSGRALRLWLIHGRISVDGHIVRDARFIVPKEGVVALLKKEPEEKELPLNVKILFEDEHLVVIHKPAGLLSVEANYTKELTAHTVLKQHYKNGRVFVVHRLDRETSGLLLFALSFEAMEGLKEQLKNHEIKREYRAFVEGCVQENQGTWRSYLLEDKNYQMHVTSNPSLGKLAITHFTVLKRLPHNTLLKVELETGRKNQIRVQAQHAGHPIVGDKKYGAETGTLNRLGLYAHSLSFVHPITQKEYFFTNQK
jgi:23S rRNA pseudouridine1911/1915/1917 synthase